LKDENRKTWLLPRFDIIVHHWSAIPGLTIIAGISEQNFQNDRILIRRRFCKFCPYTGKNQSG